MEEHRKRRRTRRKRRPKPEAIVARLKDGDSLAEGSESETGEAISPEAAVDSSRSETETSSAESVAAKAPGESEA